MATIDQVTAEIIRNALDTIASEMSITMYRTARSPIANETKDYSTAIFDAKGRMVAQTLGCPILMGASKWSVEAILREFRYDLHHGDVIVNNDPYSGGSHCGDMTIAMPVFYKNRLILFPATRSHLVDAGGGGNSPGGFNPKAVEVLEESLSIPPLKLFEAGQVKHDVFDWILRNCRFKEWTIGDIEAMIASCRIAQRRINELLDKYGEATVSQSVDYALDYSERRFRDEIGRWPDGTYVGETYLDSDGFYTWDIKLKVTATIKGSDLTIDFTGTAPQTKGFANSPIGNTWSWTFIALSTMIPEEIPKNEGIFRPVRLIAPLGTVVNPREGAPNGFCTVHPGAEISEAVTAALAKALPERVGAAWDKRATPVVSGFDPRRRRPYLSLNFVMMNGGDGATYGHDGWGGLSVMRGGMAYATVEMTEVQYPHRIEEREFIPDSAGPGKWRGGGGVKTVERMIDHEANATVMVWGGKYPSIGLCEGKPGMPNAAFIRYGGDALIELHGGESAEVLLKPGECICTIKGGGGGWGDPSERNPGLVREDVIDGYVSVEGAARDYGVCLDPATLEIDYGATALLRGGRKLETE